MKPTNTQNPFKVGDIVYDSWGYDQTNIDWYQVVKCTPKSVVIRRIAGEITEKENTMSGQSTPLIHCFTGTPIRKRVQPGTCDLASNHGCMRKWDGKPKYVSWYC